LAYGDVNQRCRGRHREDEHRGVAEIETAWGDHVGPEEFDNAMRVLDRLVNALDEERAGGTPDTVST
jgi:hypothetical protein